MQVCLYFINVVKVIAGRKPAVFESRPIHTNSVCHTSNADCIVCLGATKDLLVRFRHMCRSLVAVEWKLNHFEGPCCFAVLSSQDWCLVR
jgi:hypothetical protein